jgi:hypothetical protein
MVGKHKTEWLDGKDECFAGSWARLVKARTVNANHQLFGKRS